MKNKNELEQIRTFVQELFLGATDKAGAPYYHHLEFVAEYGRNIALALGLGEEEAETVYLAGLCHDALEDCGDKVSEAELGALIGNEALGVVLLLTNREGKAGYEAYFERVKENRLASIVKAADASQNADLTRFPEEERTEERRRKSLFYARHAMELFALLLTD